MTAATAHKTEDEHDETEQANMTRRPRMRSPRSVRGWATLVLTGAVCIALVALLIVGAAMLSNYIDDRRTESARTDAVAAATTEVVEMLGYDYETADQTLPAAADGLTGDFREEYLKLVDESIVPGAKEKQLTVKVTVQAAAVMSSSPDSVDVLMYLNQVTTSKDNPQAVTMGSRLRVSMQHVDGHWLVSQLEPI